MRIRTPTDLGAVLRDRRKELKLDQATLAQRIGVSRQWLVGVERGRARAELGLVLRALDAVGLSVYAFFENPRKPRPKAAGGDIDAIIAAAQKKT
jgi:y4mF family transcriptional regulator